MGQLLFSRPEFGRWIFQKNKLSATRYGQRVACAK